MSSQARKGDDPAQTVPIGNPPSAAKPQGGPAQTSPFSGTAPRAELPVSAPTAVPPPNRPAAQPPQRETNSPLSFGNSSGSPRPTSAPVPVPPLGNPAAAKPATESTESHGMRNQPASGAPMHEVKLPPPIKLQRAEVRSPQFQTISPPRAEGKSKIHLLPWSQLSVAQKAGRGAAILVGALFVAFLIRLVGRGLHGGGAPSAPTAQAPADNSALSPGDRNDGMESLCKVFNIYGIPKTDHDVAEDAKNAVELFKLGGNQSPERSAYILTTMGKEFVAGTLTAKDCAAAGTPLDSPEANVPFGGAAPGQAPPPLPPAAR